jgi:molybdate/tungstate transport system ATP-binding protein
MIEVTQLALRQGSFSLNNISFSIPAGQYGVLMGRTGCGKTSLLEAICGLRRVAGGQIRLSARDVTALKPAERDVGYVPQDRALFQTMTVRKHLSFALEIRQWKEDQIRTRVSELAQLLAIEHLLDRKPHGLSGGEAQRVALGRALAARPQVLCLDEPLSALDDETREEMYALLKSVQQHTHVTTLHVTHHVLEAQRLGDTILILKDGKVSTRTDFDSTIQRFNDSTPP